MTPHNECMHIVILGQRYEVRKFVDQGIRQFQVMGLEQCPRCDTRGRLYCHFKIGCGVDAYAVCCGLCIGGIYSHHQEASELARKVRSS
jgi:hypothetical protein